MLEQWMNMLNMLLDICNLVSLFPDLDCHFLTFGCLEHGCEFDMARFN
jgi:hypothetical protein